jgi:hypothetical protein
MKGLAEDSGIEYSPRVLEMQCTNDNGMSATDWYFMPLVEREWKVAATMLPNVYAALEQKKHVRELKSKGVI